MKKKSGIQRAIARMTVEELEKLNTKALLARLQRLRFCEESKEQSDLNEDEIVSVADKILFKSDPAWKAAYRDLKQLLNQREHVDN